MEIHQHTWLNMVRTFNIALHKQLMPSEYIFEDVFGVSPLLLWQQHLNWHEQNMMNFRYELLYKGV